MADLADVLQSYAEFLRPTKQYRHFLNTSRTNHEAAIAEAVTFGILQQCGVKPVLADLPGKGGPDFQCLVSDRDTFMVEATSFTLAKVCKDTKLKNEIPADLHGQAYSLLTQQINGKALDKKEQLENEEMPVVLAIASNHIHAGLVLNPMAALNALLSQPYWTGNSPNMSVDFRYSAFLKRSDNGEIIVKHPSLSAVILIAITSRQSTVCGALNPAPNHKLKAQHLYNIPFAYLKDWPIEKNVARCEWTMGNTGQFVFPHAAIRAI